MSVYQSAPTLEQAAITAKDFNFWYGDFHALTGLDLNIAKNAITSFIGPSGCGKSTFLRCINRMNDLIEGTRIEGTMTLDGNDIYAEGVDPVDLRRRVGMIFQQPNPFPKSIYENVAFGPRLQGVTSKSDLDDIQGHPTQGRPRGQVCHERQVRCRYGALFGDHGRPSGYFPTADGRPCAFR